MYGARSGMEGQRHARLAADLLLRYASIRNVNAARSAPAAVSTIQGMTCSPVAWSKYSSRSPDASEWRDRSKSPRLWTP